MRCLQGGGAAEVTERWWPQMLHSYSAGNVIKFKLGSDFFPKDPLPYSCLLCWLAGLQETAQQSCHPVSVCSEKSCYLEKHRGGDDCVLRNRLHTPMPSSLRSERDLHTNPDPAGGCGIYMGKNHSPRSPGKHLLALCAC